MVSLQLDAPTSSPSTVVFTISLVSLISTHVLLSPSLRTPKQKSWIITNIASLVMTLASLPFLFDFASSLSLGSTTAAIGWEAGEADSFAVLVNRFFQAYCCSDILAGALFYPTQVNFLSGWFHHTLYICIVEYCIRRGWAHVFCLCAFMEVHIPLLGIVYRSDLP